MTEPDRKAALLQDLAALLAKYGPGPFQALGEALGDSTLLERLSELLPPVATPRQQRLQESKAQKQGPDRLDRVGLQLMGVGGSHEITLRPLINAMSAGRDQPRLKDLKAFAERNGIPVPKSSSRRDVTAHLVAALTNLSADELEPLAAEIEALSQPRDRALDGWNRIIERSRVQSTD